MDSSGLQLFGWPFLAAILGLLIGWLLWGRRAHGAAAEAARLKEQIASENRSHTERVSQLTARVAEIDPLKTRCADAERAAAASEATAQKTQVRIKEVESQLVNTVASLEQARRTSAELATSRERRIAELEGQLAETRERQRSVESRLEARILGLQQEVATAGELEDRLHASIAERESLIQQLDRRVTSLNEAAERVPSLEAEIVMLSHAHTGVRTRAEDLERALSAAVRGREEQGEALASASALISEREREIEAIQVRLNEASAPQRAMAATVGGTSLDPTALLASKDAEIDALRNTIRTLSEQPDPIEVRRLAHSYAAARGFQGGSEQDDWFRAEAEIRARGRKAV